MGRSDRKFEALQRQRTICIGSRQKSQREWRTPRPSERRRRRLRPVRARRLPHRGSKCGPIPSSGHCSNQREPNACPSESAGAHNAALQHKVCCPSTAPRPRGWIGLRRQSSRRSLAVTSRHAVPRPDRLEPERQGRLHNARGTRVDNQASLDRVELRG